MNMVAEGILHRQNMKKAVSKNMRRERFRQNKGMRQINKQGQTESPKENPRFRNRIDCFLF
jgi:hypothetical protein